MKFKAIIAEFNPFHNGHKHLIDSIKGADDLIIIIMSSSFTQRGKPGILDKFTRAKIALNNGADIVLELPSIFSSSSAEIFAKGAIGILNSLDCVDELCFGAEDKLEDLLEIDRKISGNENNSLDNLKFYLSKGLSFLQARELSYNFLSSEELAILKKPNNILAFEYIKALKATDSETKAHAIKRYKIDHDSSFAKENFASSSYIRKLARAKEYEEIKNLMPRDSYRVLKNKNKVYLNDYLDIFKYKLINDNINFSDYVDYENGLENRFYKYIDSKNMEEYIRKISSKRYTHSRISRLISHILLDIKKDFIFESYNQPYIRVLASNKRGFDLLKELKKKDIFYIDKFSKINDLDENSILKRIALKESQITDSYELFNQNILNKDYLTNFIIKKQELRD